MQTKVLVCFVVGRNHESNAVNELDMTWKMYCNKRPWMRAVAAISISKTCARQLNFMHKSRITNAYSSTTCIWCRIGSPLCDYTIISFYLYIHFHWCRYCQINCFGRGENHLATLCQHTSEVSPIIWTRPQIGRQDIAPDR